MSTDEDSPNVSGGATRNDPPVPTDWGLVVRPIGGSSSVTRSTDGEITVVPANAAPVVLLTENLNRLGFSIRNTSTTATLYVKASIQATPVSAVFHTVALKPCGYYEDPFHYVNEVSGVWVGVLDGAAMVTDYLP